MRPIGRHHTSGLSLLLSAMRFFLSSAAQGWSGSANPRPATSKNCDTGMALGSGGLGAAGAAAPAPRPRPPPPPPPPNPGSCQMPDKSGLPSGVRGVGASRFGLPSGVRGTPGVGYDGHCAPSDGASATHTAITHTALNHRVIQDPPAV